MLFLATFLIFLLAVTGLAVGVLAGREPLRGSCGGAACTRCRGNCEKTDRRNSTTRPHRGRG